MVRRLEPLGGLAEWCIDLQRLRHWRVVIDQKGPIPRRLMAAARKGLET